MELPNKKICRVHKFVTYSDIEFDQHLNALPHYVEAGEGVCENCKNKIKNVLVPIKSFGYPYKTFCDNCKQKLNYALETIGKQRASEIYQKLNFIVETATLG